MDVAGGGWLKYCTYCAYTRSNAFLIAPEFTSLLHGCYKDVARMLHGCCMDVEVARMMLGCCLNVACMLLHVFSRLDVVQMSDVAKGTEL